MNPKVRSGFTLIELLIVIAIILILIAIALPNFLEAQIRARVTKAKAEIRTVTIALESYFLDFRIYPSESEDNMRQRGRTEAGLAWLTSPIAYITSVPEDPFGGSGSGDDPLRFYETGGAEAGLTYPKCTACLVSWAIYTQGPDLQSGDVVSDHPHYGMYADGSVDAYSPTNGTKSQGDIFQYGGDPFWIGVSMSIADMGIYRNGNGASDARLVVNGENFLHRLPPKLQ